MGVSAQLFDFIFAEMVSQEEDQPLIQATREAGNVYYGLTFESLNDHPAKKKDLTGAKDGQKTAAINWPVVVDNNPDSGRSD